MLIQIYCEVIMVKYILMFVVFAAVVLGVMFKAGNNVSLGDEHAQQSQQHEAKPEIIPAAK